MPIGFTLLSLIGCGDLVEAELMNAEFDNRDLKLSAIDERVAELETAVGAQQETISGQAATIETQQATIEMQQAAIEMQQAAIAALDAAMTDSTTGLLARLDALEAAGLSTDEALADHEAAIGELQVRATSGAAATAALSLQVAGLDSDVSSLSALVTSLDTAVADLEASDGGGGVWSDEGSGSGNCARANVSTTSAGPLYVFGTIETSFSMSAGCASTGYASCYGTSVSTGTGSTSGSVTLNAENSAGTWSDAVSTSSELTGAFTPATTYSSGGGTYLYYSGNSALSYTWTVPVQAVFVIPAAGDYVIDLESTGFTGACRLAVVQP